MIIFLLHYLMTLSINNWVKKNEKNAQSFFSRGEKQPVKHFESICLSYTCWIGIGTAIHTVVFTIVALYPSRVPKASCSMPLFPAVLWSASAASARRFSGSTAASAASRSLPDINGQESTGSHRICGAMIIPGIIPGGTFITRVLILVVLNSKQLDFMRPNHKIRIFPIPNKMYFYF